MMGSEFGCCDRVARGLVDGVFLGGAYVAWRRGSTGDLDGLMREFVPKCSNFNVLLSGNVGAIGDKLDNRPRKRYNWLTLLSSRCGVGEQYSKRQS
jgi:IS30 family transposase